MPGAFLAGRDNPSANNDDGPGVILFTGIAATNLNRIERPLTPTYAQGFSDYAGMNVRVLGDNFRDGRSTIANVKIPAVLLKKLPDVLLRDQGAIERDPLQNLFA